jgi:aspartate-semialdehyde dehydrogenase
MKMMKDCRFVVVGATGLVGSKVLSLLAEMGCPVANIAAVSSDRSAGSPVSFGERGALKTQPLSSFDFSSYNIAFFCVDSNISKQYAPKAASDGCVVIDKSSFFRLDPQVPLVVPEVNAQRLASFGKKNIVANPNCIVVPLAVVLKPLHDEFKATRVVVSTYQSVSGAGKAGMDELYRQSKSYFVNEFQEPEYFAKRIAFNVIPAIDDFYASGFTGEEEKICYEIKKIVDPSIKVCATCVRVPVFIGHSMSVNMEFANPLSLEKARDILLSAPGVQFINDDGILTPIDVAYEDSVFVSRLRQDLSVKNGLALWISCDNLMKGAALNAVQIAEKLMEHI